MDNNCKVKEVNVDLLVGNENQREDNNEPFYKNRFIIPNYQRGYRWTKSEVEILLDDISAAMQSKMEKYCLQPVIILKRDEENTEGFFFGEIKEHTVKTWKVIDGQQRITTIFLILRYLSTMDKTADCFELEYDTRDTTTNKLKNWVNNVYDYNPRPGTQTPFPMISFENNDGLDVYYLKNALSTIVGWFSNKNQNYRKEYDTYLRNNVICLWYEFEMVNNSIDDEIKLFSRTNMGKIPLTVSELLKAILLKKRAENLEIIDSDDNEQKKKNNKYKLERAKEQQFQRAVQWDLMEQKLSEDCFFRFIYSEKKEFETRMDYLFLLEYLLDNPEVNFVPEKEEVFRYYEKKILEYAGGNENSLWEKVSSHFDLLREWYQDRIAFHKIGFLIATGSTPSVITLRDLIRSYYDSECKTLFYGEKLDIRIKESLQAKLRKSDCGVFCLNDIDKLTYEDKSDVQVILLLFNILTAMKSPDYRFAFEYVYPLDEGCSIEHIFPQTPTINSIVKSFRENYKSFRGTKEDIKDSSIKSFVTKVKSEFKTIGKKAPTFIPGEGDALLSKWWDDVMSALGITADSVQSIGNLALISKNLNTKLTNNMFFAKQKEIKEFDKNGEFLPICTHNVFLKYYSIGEGHTSGLFWEKDDINKHKESIKTFLADYLPKGMPKEGVSNE